MGRELAAYCSTVLSITRHKPTTAHKMNEATSNLDKPLAEILDSGDCLSGVMSLEEQPSFCTASRTASHLAGEVLIV